jgi:nicotinate-nucleotide adenylyltransferase
MHIGVLGGTFDPPHYGHFVLAEWARDQLSLERVLWVPAASPPHKVGLAVTPVEHRLAMLELALAEADNPAFEVSLVDMQRPGPHYTADMLELLAADFPGAHLFFLIGADSLCNLPTWRDPDRLIRQAKLVVMPRLGVACNLDELDAAIRGLRDRLVFLDAPVLDIAAHRIREWVACGRSVRYLLPAGVESYVREHNLYQDRE